VNGLKKKSDTKFVLGYTDTETVKLDFDNTSFRDVKYWAFRAMKWFRLKGFIILESSENHYHVVFNRKVSWSENMHRVAWVSLLSHNPMLEKWFLMQAIKEGSTLRVSPKTDKPGPKIVFRYGKQDKQIREFLSYRKLVKKIIWKLKTEMQTDGTFTMRTRDVIT
jgi:hypothetical protein